VPLPNLSTRLSWSHTGESHTAQLPLECCSKQHGTAVKRVIVALHGFGDNARNFCSVAEELPIKDTLWICLQAPEAPPFPGDGGQWYELFGNPHTQLKQSCDKVKACLDIIQQSTQVDWSQIVLFGFSQGAFVSLLTALTLPRQLAGVVALSGYLAQAHRIKLPHPERVSLPVFLAHGLQDQVVFPAQHFETKDILESFGFNQVTAKTYRGLAHSLCGEEIFDIKSFIEALP
jgi:phospholipase/carboxylesterase